MPLNVVNNILTSALSYPQVTKTNQLFRGTTSFNGDLSRWDVGQVTNMSAMFEDATSFNGDLSSWDVGQVTRMHGTFSGASSFNRQLGGAWSGSTAVGRTGMFQGSGGSIV